MLGIHALHIVPGVAGELIEASDINVNVRLDGCAEINKWGSMAQRTDEAVKAHCA